MNAWPKKEQMAALKLKNPQNETNCESCAGHSPEEEGKIAQKSEDESKMNHRYANTSGPSIPTDR